MDRSGRRYTQYKNFKIYSDSVSKNEKLLSAYDKIKSSTKSKNQLKSVVNDIVIDEDWVNTIEELLPYVSSAINEERRFIRNESETLPIEKTRRVTKESIVNLSMNSQNIRKIKENDEIEPSKLLVVEKLDDYSIYENKFLVFLLKFLKSFIEIRFEKIREAKSLLETRTKLNDKVNLYRNTISYKLEIVDERYGDLNLEENDKDYDIIRRIRNIEVQINHLLKTDLIEQVSKTPPIRQPIQRTNLLKNDVNFSKCLKLYDFISSYAKPGYTITPVETLKEELSQDYLDYFSKIPTLVAFLSYAETKGVYELYAKEFEIEKEENRVAELVEINRKIYEMLGTKEVDFKLVYEFVIGMQEERIRLNKTIEELNVNHEKEIEELKTAFENEKNEIFDKHREEVNKLNEDISNLEKENAAKVDLINKNFDDYRLDAEKKIKDLSEQNEELTSRLTVAQITNGKAKFNENITEKEFDELERQKFAFDKYFEKTWKKLKKEIMKNRKAEAINEVKNARAKKKEMKGVESEQEQEVK